MSEKKLFDPGDLFKQPAFWCWCDDQIHVRIIMHKTREDEEVGEFAKNHIVFVLFLFQFYGQFVVFLQTKC